MRRTYSFHRQIVLLAVACVLGVTLGAGAAWGQEGVALIRRVERGVSPDDDNWAGGDRLIVILRSTGEVVTATGGCGSLGGLSFLMHDAVVIDPGGAGTGDTAHPTLTHIQMGRRTEAGELPLGTMITDITTDARVCCTDAGEVVVSCGGAAAETAWHQFFGFIQNPRHADIALFTASESLEADHIGVVTGQVEEDGTANVIFTRRGSPPIQTQVVTGTRLEPGDRIVEIVEVETNTETGGTTYVGMLEY